MNITREKFAEEWHEKISKEELYNKIDENKQIIGEQHLDLDEVTLEQRAVIATRLELKKLSLIPSVQFRGFVLGATDTVDIGRIKKEQALKAYSENQEKALRENLVKIENGDVIPIDNREFFDISRQRRNPNYRQSLQDSCFKSIYGICKRNGDSNFKRFVMMLNNKYSELDFKFNTPLKWRGKDATQVGDDFYRISSNMATNGFVYDESIRDTDLRSEVIKSFKTDAVSLKQLKTWWDKNKDDRNKIVAVEGYVVSLSIQPSAKGNYSVILDDESLSTEEVVGSFVKQNIFDSCNISVGSKILAFARPLELEDNETHQPKILLNLVGVYTYPEYVTPKPEKISEESISPKTEISDDELL